MSDAYSVSPDMETVEFVHGPLDGETRLLSRTLMDYYIALPSCRDRIVAFYEDFTEPWRMPEMRRGHYRRVLDKPQLMVWQGEF